MNDIRNGEIKNLHQIEKLMNIIYSKLGKEKITLELSTEYQDTNLSYDAVCSDGTKLSLRGRGLNYFYDFKDVTIRRLSKGGYRCEYQKIQEGLGDMYFYYWDDDDGIKQFIYYSIDKMRCLLDGNNKTHYNKDGTGLSFISIADLFKHDSVVAISYGLKGSSK